MHTETVFSLLSLIYITIHNLQNREDYGTALSKYVWFLRDNNVRFDLKWSIKKKAQVYSAGAKYCDLCLTEKTIIMLADKKI